MPNRVLVMGDSMSLAHVARAMVMARRLAGEGADIVFATGSAHLALARREGFDPCEMHCVPPARAYDAIRSGSHIFDMPTLVRYVKSDLALFQRVRPDLIVGDMRLSLNISAELAGLEYWSILSGYMTAFYAAPSRPPRTLPLNRLLGQRVSRLVFPTIKRMILRRFANSFRRLRSAWGMAPVRDIFDVMASPYRNLIADLPAYTPCASLPDHFDFVGPLPWEPNTPDPVWLDRIAPDRPTAYVTMGSTGDPSALRRILLSLRDSGWQVLTTIGTHGSAPDGVFAADMARGSTLLRHSHVTVCHGGSGTVYQSVAHGVPVVGLPTFHDQETNMERVEALGWGAGLDPNRWRPADLHAALARVRTDECRAAVACGRAAIAASVARFEQTSWLAPRSAAAPVRPDRAASGRRCEAGGSSATQAASMSLRFRSSRLFPSPFFGTESFSPCAPIPNRNCGQ